MLNINGKRYSKTFFYRKWWHIRARCMFTWDKDYHNYGGRGIKFEWEKYQDFVKDMYEPYLLHAKKHGEKNTTIERINVNGNYCKKNCRWATLQEQSNNTRKSRKLKLGKKTKTLSEWARIAEISSEALSYRIKHGLSLKKAMTLELKYSNKYGSLRTPKKNNKGK